MSKQKDTKQITVHVDKDLHGLIKAQAKSAGKTLQDYVVNLLEKDVKKTVKKSKKSKK